MGYKGSLAAGLIVCCQLLFTQGVSGQARIFSLSEVRAGMRGVGRTVFSGDRVEEFQVEILGVLKDAGPKQSIILARLSGGPLAQTGVLQGMSGSPVYIDGRLVGAVALSFPFSKEPIAGIRPIEEMLRVGQAAGGGERRAVSRAMGAEPERLVNIATPIGFHGFSPEAVEYFAPRLRELGLEPRQGVSSGASLPPKMGDPARLKPGDMISVELMSGDMSVGADGTVTAIEGRKVYAFGHPFLDTGSTQMPFARAEVLTLLPNVNSSFKISEPREWMGAITQDRGTAIAGELGKTAATAPLTIRVKGVAGETVYRMRVVSDRLLTPLLVQMAIFTGITATERNSGDVAYEVAGQARFQVGAPALEIKNSFAGDLGVAAMAALGVTLPLYTALNSDFEALKLAGMDLTIEAREGHRLMTIAQVTSSRREIAPGGTVEIGVTMSGPDGRETRRNVLYEVPVGTPAGALQFVVSDAGTANAADYQALSGAGPRTPARLIGLLNGLRDNGKAYLRVMRADAAFALRGQTMPDPPPSLALVLSRSMPGAALGTGSKMAEIAIDTGGDVVSGSQTATVQVKP